MVPPQPPLGLPAAKMGVPCYEVPTGWKYFGNLMDADARFAKTRRTPLLCGEESFGTSSDHIREKDGMWAMLAWLSVLAQRNMSVREVMAQHWRQFGRNYYQRHDYEGVNKADAQAMMQRLVGLCDMFQLGGHSEQSPVSLAGGHSLVSADDFEYHDPIDDSVTSHQGIRLTMRGGSRVIFRLSGTGVGGATVRMYLERYVAVGGDLDMEPVAALQSITEAAVQLSQIAQFTGRSQASIIT